MSKKEDFKLYVKNHPELIKYVKNGDMTWQKFFEIYSIYGTDNSIWNQYFKEEKENIGISDIIDMVKKVDLENVQKNITNISKVVDLIQSLINKDEIPKNEIYTPRPLYKKFED